MNISRLKGKEVLTPQEAFIMSRVLSDNHARQITFGLNSLLNIPGRSVAVKTGTTDDQRDNWAIGWTPQVVVGVWVGNNDNSKMTTVASGVSGATPIWRRSILAALEGKPVVEFRMPSGIETVLLRQCYRIPCSQRFYN
jgi:membrane carboxypeptidase/penicillin-binding protein